jgi:hypothetical protein
LAASAPFVLALFAGPRSAAAEPPALQATLTCAAASEAGRVRCEVEALVTAVPGATIKWADAEILKVPDLITPLKGRIGPRDAALKEPQLWRLSLALVAKRAGSGPVVVRVRVVACQTVDGKERCAPLSVEATGQVRVGQ